MSITVRLVGLDLSSEMMELEEGTKVSDIISQDGLNLLLTPAGGEASVTGANVELRDGDTITMSTKAMKAGK